MSEKPAKPKVLFGTPTVPPPKTNEPKVLAGGVRRRRIACSIADLQAEFPEANTATLQRALRCVHSINLDDSHFDDVAKFGAELQEEHETIAALRRSIAGHVSTRQAKEIIADVTVMFEQLDPERLFTSNAGSAWHVWRRWISPARSGETVYRHTHARILKRIEGFAGLERDLMDAAERLGRLAPRYAVLAEKFDSCVLAANFVVNTCARDALPPAAKSHYAAQIDLLGQRAANLTASRATVDADRVANVALECELRALAAADVVLREELLPGFDAAFAAALTSPDPLGTPLFALRGHYHRTHKFLKETNP